MFIHVHLFRFLLLDFHKMRIIRKAVCQTHEDDDLFDMMMSESFDRQKYDSDCQKSDTGE